MKRYSEYSGANTTMGCLAREFEDGDWIKYEDYLKEKLNNLGGASCLLLADVAIQEKVLGWLERLHGYLGSGETYCFDNQWDEADAEELKELIDRIKSNVA